MFFSFPGQKGGNPGIGKKEPGGGKEVAEDSERERQR